MTSQRIFSLLFLIMAIVLIAWWFADGHHAWTSTQSLVNVTTTDELFGTKVTTQQWVDDFTPGFFPFSNMNASTKASGIQSVIYSIIGFAGIGVMAFIFLALAVWCWILARKRAKRIVI